MMISLELIKQLREETGAPLMEVRKALEEADGNLEKARGVLRGWAAGKVEKLEGRQATEGAVISYIHNGNKVGAMIELSSETDFVARNEEFLKLGYEVAMQVASMDPQSVAELLDQEYIRESKRKISDLVKETSAKFGEKITVVRFVRFAVGK